MPGAREAVDAIGGDADLARTTGPDRRTAIRGLLLRALAPAVALWVAISAFGRLLTGPMVGWNHSEIALNRSLQDIPVLVAYARLYRGMHHLSDVVIGAINGLVCAALAAHCLLHRRRLPASDS